MVIPMNSKVKNSPKIIHSLLRLWSHINLRRRKQYILLLLLMIIASFAEVISIGSLIPFLGALANPEKIFSNEFLQPIIIFFDLHSSNEVVILLMFVFCFFAILSGVIRLTLLKFTNSLSFATGADLTANIYERTLYQPYKIHIARNTSEIITGIANKSSAIIFNIILPLLNILSTSIMILAILSTLIYVDPLICFATSFVFGIIYILIAKQTKNKKIENSYIISNKSTKIIKTLQEGLGGIRDVLIDGNQKIYLNSFRDADLKVRAAQASNLFLGLSPRYILESLGMILIALLAFYLFTREGGISSAIPILGILALGAQRLLPVMQQAYTSWSAIQGGYRSLEDVLALLDQPLPSNYKNSNKSRLQFKKDITLDGVYFKYISNAPFAISDINFSIKKGEKIGIIGKTGSGKSTLIDILMGLLEPVSGHISVDGEIISYKNVSAWQKHLAHVPQSIFLADTTIAENIALGLEHDDIDLERIHLCAEKAQLKNVISNLSDGYETIVGERGVRLSGGQQQRIAIARALYKNADVLVFDEATSALDNQTEDSVMQAIEGLGREITVIMIAHRLTTLKKCTKIIKLAEGKVDKIGSYKDIIKKN